MCCIDHDYVATMTPYFYLRYQQQGGNTVQYKLFYKIFCFTNIYNLLTESLEAAFLFEQVTINLLLYIPSNHCTSSYNSLLVPSTMNAQHNNKCYIHIVLMRIQMCDQVVNGLFPTDNATLLKLASLRIQYLEGDYEPGAVM